MIAFFKLCLLISFFSFVSAFLFIFLDWCSSLLVFRLLLTFFRCLQNTAFTFGFDFRWADFFYTAQVEYEHMPPSHPVYKKYVASSYLPFYPLFLLLLLPVHQSLQTRTCPNWKHRFVHPLMEMFFLSWLKFLHLFILSTIHGAVLHLLNFFPLLTFFALLLSGRFGS